MIQTKVMRVLNTLTVFIYDNALDTFICYQNGRIPNVDFQNKSKERRLPDRIISLASMHSAYICLILMY